MSRKLEKIQFTKQSLKNFEKMEKFLLGKDLILMLLCVSPIKGTTKLQKQVFLTSKTLFKKETADLGFFPYKFGAYSKSIDDSIDVLEIDGLIKIKKGRDEIVQYVITPKGKRSISKKIRKLDISLEELEKKKSDWDELTTRGIMKLVYRKYPEYTIHTKVPYLKW